jgi:thiol-disulfide isomerase/thioredoxin
VKLADYQGKLVIVDIWGTWCPPCRQEIPHFVQLKKDFPDDLDIVGVNYEHGDPEEAVPKIVDFVKETGINYTCVIGDDATREQIPEFRGFPTTLFVDRTGKVRLKVVGYHPYDKLRTYIDALLAEGEESPPAG